MVVRLKDIAGFAETILSKESDRGCALIISEGISDILREILEFVMVPGRGGKVPDRADARLSLAFGLGIIDDAENHDFKKMKGVRNDAAHVANPFVFSAQHLAEIHGFRRVKAALNPRRAYELLGACALRVLLDRKHAVSFARENAVDSLQRRAMLPELNGPSYLETAREVMSQFEQSVRREQ
jgi:hypothetical protein